MTTGPFGIDFQAMGIGTVLHRHELRVPPNQRSYKWSRAHVEKLMQDFAEKVRTPGSPYFLGTIVLTRGSGGAFEVADGQQRLATTAILLSAIRDFLLTKGGANEKKTASDLTRDYLLRWNPREGSEEPKLTLNTEDASFFTKAVLQEPAERDNNAEQQRLIASNERLKDAASVAPEHIKAITNKHSAHGGFIALYDWIDFLRDRVIVVAIIAPQDTDAYKMFETLNDRGLKASQADILKNFLLSQSGNRVAEAQSRWNSMTSVIEAHAQSGKEDDLLIDFLRHYWITQQGPTIERELADSIRLESRGQTQSMKLIEDLDCRSVDYIALLSAMEHPRWSAFFPSSRRYIYTITGQLGIEQIRPLLLAIMARFPAEVADEAFRLCLSYSVRFLIAGGGGGGRLDNLYGTLAKKITEGRVVSAKQINEEMSSAVPDDQRFFDAFKRHQATKSHLARYYLSALEFGRLGVSRPEIAFTDNHTRFNLEHVLPENPSENWTLPKELMKLNYKRLGNLAMMRPEDNVEGGNRTFGEKKAILAKQVHVLTQDIADYEDWGPQYIDQRQEALAKIACDVWRL